MRIRVRVMAVQVDLMKPTLKAPGTSCLNLIYDEPLSNFAFKLNLRRYSAVPDGLGSGVGGARREPGGGAVQVDPRLNPG